MYTQQCRASNFLESNIFNSAANGGTDSNYSTEKPITDLYMVSDLKLELQSKIEVMCGNDQVVVPQSPKGGFAWPLELHFRTSLQVGTSSARFYWIVHRPTPDVPGVEMSILGFLASIHAGPFLAALSRATGMPHPPLSL